MNSLSANRSLALPARRCWPWSAPWRAPTGQGSPTPTEAHLSFLDTASCYTHPCWVSPPIPETGGKQESDSAITSPQTSSQISDTPRHPTNIQQAGLLATPGSSPAHHHGANSEGITGKGCGLMSENPGHLLDQSWASQRTVVPPKSQRHTPSSQKDKPRSSTALRNHSVNTAKQWIQPSSSSWQGTHVCPVKHGQGGILA